MVRVKSYCLTWQSVSREPYNREVWKEGFLWSRGPRQRNTGNCGPCFLRAIINVAYRQIFLPIGRFPVLSVSYNRHRVTNPVFRLKLSGLTRRCFDSFLVTEVG